MQTEKVTTENRCTAKGQCRKERHEYDFSADEKSDQCKGKAGEYNDKDGKLCSFIRTREYKFHLIKHLNHSVWKSD